MNDIKKHNFSLKKQIRLTRGVWVKTVWPKIQIGRGCWPAMKSRQYCWNPGTQIRRRWMPGDKLTSAGLAYIRPRRDQPLSRCQVINQRNRQHCWRCFCRPLWTMFCFVLLWQCLFYWHVGMGFASLAAAQSDLKLGLHSGLVETRERFSRVRRRKLRRS